MSFNNSNFTSVIFKATSYANAGAERNFTGSKMINFSKVFENISQK